MVTINVKFYFGGKVFAEVEGIASYLNEAELALAVKCGAINRKLNECNMFTFCEFAEVEAVKNYRSLQTLKVENPPLPKSRRVVECKVGYYISTPLKRNGNRHIMCKGVPVSMYVIPCTKS